MKTASEQRVLRSSRLLVLSGAAIAAISIAACMGSIGSEGTGGTGGGIGPGGTGAGNGGGPGSGASSTSGSASATSGTYGGAGTGMNPIVMGNPPVTSGSSGAVTAGPLDPGSVAMHRLNAFEYDNTINDLLGLQQKLAETTFLPDEKGTTGFDNEAAAFTMNDAEFTQYFNAADALGEQVFASPALLANVIPAGTTQDAAGLLSVMNSFGQRAYRRPLFADEVARFQALATASATNGADFNGQVKQVVKMMLSSVPFLYRMEFDATPGSTAAHAVGPYELASRLSYLLWSSMPDATLFADAAAAGTANLTQNATLQAEVTRMLADSRAKNFVSSFAGQWLGARDVGAHQVEPTAFPTWSEPLRQAYMQEMAAYFGEFLNGNLPWTQFLTAQVNFVNGANAKAYAVNSPTAATATNGIAATQTTMTKVTNMDPNRIGFMGLGGFLTQSSYSYRTVPTLRGKWVLLYILGEPVPPPPAGIPPLDGAPTAATTMSTQQENVRARLLAHRTASATCAGCHNRLDPIGLGMENFDGIGQYRSAYGNGQAIDSSGVLPDGTTFTSVAQLAGILSTGTRLQEMTGFAAQQVMTYALARALNLDPTMGTDTPYLTQIQTGWTAQNYSFKQLITDVVMNDTFRFRHGGV